MGITSVAISDGTAEVRGAATVADDATYRAMAIEYVRSLVEFVPGSGQIRGVWVYKGDLYVFRDNELGSACIMYKATNSGWSVVTTPTLLPGGRYEFVNYNFYGASALQEMYGCDGVNKAFKFDGTTFTQLTTGMVTDTPKHIVAHKYHLFLSFAGGSVQHSAVGDPTSWTPVLGAGEIAVGDDVTGITTVNNLLVIFTRNQTYLLYGSSSADWQLNLHASDSGAKEWTVQTIGVPTYLDDRGITTLSAVQEYGDFKSATISTKFQKLLNTLAVNDAVSLRVRDKDQYRLFFSNGENLNLTFNRGKFIGGTRFDYGKIVRCCCSSESSSGNEVLYFGSDDGYVYKIDSGTSFDGSSVDAWVRTSYNHFKSPQNYKRFYKVVVELDAKTSFDLFLLPDYSYGSQDLPSSDQRSIEVIGGGGFWDTDYWSQFYWDAQVISEAYGYIDGIGSNLSLYIRSNDTYEDIHTLQGMIVHFTPQGVVR